MHSMLARAHCQGALRRRCRLLIAGWRSMGSQKQKNLHEQYERKTPIEHVLLRPGMYVGNTEWQTSSQWIFDSAAGSMVKRDVATCPALLKLFDEILVNAADCAQNDKSMAKLDVDVAIHDENSLQISITNDGMGIPVALHEKEHIYIPELIFGHLLTGSNFNDADSRFTGGSHGYGAKLANIFSRRFSVEVLDSQRGLHYKQSWAHNMSQCEPPVITPIVGASKGFVKISFEPDLTRFPLPAKVSSSARNKETETIDDESTDVAMVEAADRHPTTLQVLHDLKAMAFRRTMDVASALVGVQVSFNGAAVPLSSFEEYARLFQREATTPIISAKLSPYFTIAVCKSPTRQLETMSFVNNIWTPRGGPHVQLILNQILAAVERAVDKRGVTSPPPNLLRNYVMLFVHSLVENPRFEGQTKEALLTRGSSFSQHALLSKATLREIVERSGIVEQVVADLEGQSLAMMTSALGASRSTRRSLSVDVPKLDDAHLAGTDRWHECTLILTEGDSAKALAVAGLAALGAQGRDTFGVLPLKGKVLNVRVASPTQVVANDDVVHLCKAMGLEFEKNYDPNLFPQAGCGLRYGRVMLMCDQDADGSHIKGLVINFFHHFWPSLLQVPGFLQDFHTPLVKVWDRKYRQHARAQGSPPQPQVFYRMQDYHQAMHAHRQAGRAISDFVVKYYKGLGTSTSQEGREYFQQLAQHRHDFLADGQEGEAIDLAFSKTRSADRREWILTSPALREAMVQEEVEVDTTGQALTYRDFVHKELVHFSMSDNLRSLPHAIDGLKRSQRKILHACFQRNLTDECKVAQLAGYIAEHTAYHHGEMALHATIVNLAQDFVGSNNIPLLVGVGQFGTRARGGHDHASARYIYTKLSPLARCVFPAEDDALLTLCEEDGKKVEPVCFLPILPMLLVNGAAGIGTGWSTSIPPHHPLALVEVLERRLDGLPLTDDLLTRLRPWYRGFQGNLAQNASGDNCTTEGLARRLSNTIVQVTELPIGRWTEEYKEQLNDLCKAGLIKGFKEFHTTETIHFEIHGSKASLDRLEAKGWAKSLKLVNQVSLGNMHAFAEDGRIKKFDSALHLIDDFFPRRQQAYEQRKQLLIHKLQWKEHVARAKSNFVQDLVHQRVRLHRSQQDLAEVLRDAGHPSWEELRSKAGIMQGVPWIIGSGSGSGGKDGQEERGATGFDYLLQMPLQSLTEDMSQQLLRRSEQAGKELAEVQAKSPRDLWMADLHTFKTAYGKWSKAIEKRDLV